MKSFGFFRAAAGVPLTVPGDVKKNTQGMLALYEKAAAEGAELVVFPELSLTGYTCGDLFAQEKLLDSAKDAALKLAAATAGKAGAGSKAKPPGIVFGLPLRAQGLLFNSAALAWGGEILGIVPKTYLPNSGEFYERRWFTSGTVLRDFPDLRELELTSGLRPVPFGTDLLFPSRREKGPVLGLEICEDLWAPVPPSLRQSLAGATLLVNISASNELAGKGTYREALVTGQSARCLAAYVYVSAGPGESSTDLVFSGDSMMAENGRLLARGERFSRRESFLAADLDMAFLENERLKNSAFSQGLEAEAAGLRFRRVLWGEKTTPLSAGKNKTPGTVLLRNVDPHPFIPSDPGGREDRCEEILNIQSSGLATRLAAIGCTKVVLGLSGGLDSTLALLVTVRAFDRLGLKRKDIYCLTMPGFGTTGRTLANAKVLASCLKVSLETVDIKEACRPQFKDLGHSGDASGAASRAVSDTAYENVQARYRTALLMNKSNMIGGLVVGTGDLSELALGWCTYNGDHMSMYGVNAGVPKTLVRHLVAHAAAGFAQPGPHTASPADKKIAAVLYDILDTPISPELLPPDREGKIIQKTEDKIGPYELHDFFLYQILRCGFPPAKVFYLARQAWEGTGRSGKGKEGGAGQRKYSPEEILKWLEVFYRRFFSQQFKRSCMPDGPKVGTISLSPRGDWRMPSDASAEEWLEELRQLKKGLKTWE